MPSSDPVTIEKVLKLVSRLNPHSILDVGAGNGRYGFLFREILDWNWGRIDQFAWQATIDALEVQASYISRVHDYVYNNILVGDWIDIEIGDYDLIFMGDILEHFENWEFALKKAITHASVVIVVAPNWRGSINQGAWMGNEHEAHKVELNPGMVGGRCLFANSKAFMTVFGIEHIPLRDVLL